MIVQKSGSDVPIGAFLSGGVDSSVVTALARRHTSDVRTFTVAMTGSDTDESSAAELVARHLGTTHTTIPLTPDDVVATARASLTEPMDNATLGGAITRFLTKRVAT